MVARPSRKLHFSLVIFFVCLLFTAVAWDHYFNSAVQIDRRIVSNLVLVMGTLFSFSAGLFAWSLESRQSYLEKEVVRRTEELLRQEKETIAAVAREEEAHRLRKETEEAYHQLEDAQDRLIQAEKLASIGRVVAGVAHELKNPLITLNGYADRLIEGPSSGQERQFIEVINHQAKRCQRTVQDLLTYAHKQELQINSVNLVSLVDQVLAEMPPEFHKSGIEIVKKFSAPAIVIQADGPQLERVFSNLLTNAWHALEDVKGSRRLAISGVLRENACEISLTDNGGGIDKENLDKIFDPFFTTRPAGKGTGLGLSLCYGIIQKHGGKIEVRSEKGKGAAFVITLPETPLKHKAA